jgi:hypothetical protein
MPRAVIYPYPAIMSLEPRYELLWALVNVGMVGGVAGWLALDVTRSRRVALVGGGMTILGHLLRIALSVVPIAGSAVADGAIAATMLLVFLGIGILSVDTLRGNRLAGW